MSGRPLGDRPAADAAREGGPGNTEAARAAAKARLREQALAARARGGDMAALTARLQAVLAPFQGRVLAFYHPIRDEADPRPAIASFDGPLCLPVVLGPGRPLLFRRYDGRLEPGRFGTSHPPPCCAEVTPEVLIVPLAGFDAAGNRLGYGGGFYDRTLCQLREKAAGRVGVTAIGLAFAGQELPAIPAEQTDQPLDLIVTDRALIRPGTPL